MPQKLTEKQNGLLAVTLRPPGLTDAAEMHALAARCGLDVNSEYSYLMVCQYFHFTSVMAEADGRVVGFISGFRIPESPSELFVWQVAVSPDFQGRGVAGRMLDEVVERLRGAGVNYVQATINPSNRASINTFSSLAGRLGCEISHRVVFSAGHFSGGGHEEEVLYRIGPFKTSPGSHGADAATNQHGKRQQS